MKIKAIVKEQNPLPCGSIYCEVEFNGLYVCDYFICNLDRQIIQYPYWFLKNQRALRAIVNAGYKYRNM